MQPLQLLGQERDAVKVMKKGPPILKLMMASVSSEAKGIKYNYQKKLEVVVQLTGRK